MSKNEWKNKKKRKIERPRETYRVESRQYREKLRGKREQEFQTTRPILPLPTPPPRETKDTSCYPHRHHTKPISFPWHKAKRPHQHCHVRPILPLANQSAQPNFVAPAFTVHTSRSIKYLIYPSKPNIMFVNLRICTCGVCIFTDDDGDCELNICICACGVFFFGFVSLWLLGSWVIIETSDRKRNSNSTGLKR